MSRLFAASKSRVFTVSLSLLAGLITQIVVAQFTTAQAVPASRTYSGSVTAYGGAGNANGSLVMLLDASKNIVDSTTVVGGSYTFANRPASESGTVYVAVLPVETASDSAFTWSAVSVGSDSATVVSDIALNELGLSGTVTAASIPVPLADVSCFVSLPDQPPQSLNGCGSTTNLQGYFAVPLSRSSAGPLRLHVSHGTYAEFYSSFTVDTPTSATSQRNKDLQLKTPNLVVVPKQSDGSGVGEGWVDINVIKSGQQGPTVVGSTRQDGKAYFRVETSTTFTLELRPNGYNWPSASSYAKQTDTTTTTGAQTSDNVVVVQKLVLGGGGSTDSPTVVVTAEFETSSTTAALAGRNLIVSYLTGSFGWQHTSKTAPMNRSLDKITSETGTAQLALLWPGLYRIEVEQDKQKALAYSSWVVNVETVTPLSVKFCDLRDFVFMGMSGSCSAQTTASLSDGLAQVPVTVQKANVVIKVMANGQSVVNANTNYMVFNPQTQFQGTSFAPRTDAAGLVLVNLNNETATKFEINPQFSTNAPNATTTSIYLLKQGATIYKCGSVSNDGACQDSATVTSAGSPVPGVAQAIVTLQNPNITWRIMYGSDTVTGTGISLMTYDTNTMNWTNGGFSFSQTGDVGLFLTPGKIYQFYVNAPNSGPAASATSQSFIVIVGGTTDTPTVTKCAMSDFNSGTGSCFAGKESSFERLAGGQYKIALAAQNVMGKVCKPRAPGAACVGASGPFYMNVEAQRKVSDAYGSYYSYFGNANVTTSGVDTSTYGNFGFSMTDPGYYKLTARKPFGASGEAATWTDTTIYIKVAVGGTISRCASLTDEVCATPESATAGSRLELAFAKPSLIGKAINSSDTNTVMNSWVEIFQPNPSQCDGCRTWLSGTQTDSQGQFYLDLPDGNYIVAINPPFGGAGANTRTEFAIKLQGGTVDTATLPSRATFANSVLSLKFSGANVTGTVKNGTAAVPNADVQAERKQGDSWTWANAYARTNSQGAFVLSLSAGTYRLRIQPPSTVSSTTLVTTAFTVTETSTTALGDLALATPTVQGTVAKESGGVLRWAWVQVDKWDDAFQNYVWSPDVSGTNTNDQGKYGLTLASGRYRVTVNPQPTDGVSKQSQDVWVLTNLTVCGVATALSAGSCVSDTKTTGVLNFTLGSGNFLGWVKKSNTETATSGSVNVEKYDATFGFWQWVDLWANVGSNGSFRLNFGDATGAGAYKLTANPPWGDNTTSRTSVWVNVYKNGDNQWKVCPASSEAAALAFTGNQCSGPEGTVTIVLTAANVKGTVLADGSPVRDAWINVQQYDSKLGFWKWLGGTNTNDKGAFAINLPAGAEFRLEINPPWNNTSGLTRKTVTIKTLSEGILTVPNIVLSSGNLKGKVTQLTENGTAVGFTAVNVEKWMKAPWDSTQYFWQWADMPINTKSDGTFNANLADTAGMLLKFTAFPSGYSNGLSKVSKVLWVVVTNGTLQWCELTQNKTLNNSNLENPFGTCELQAANTDLKLALLGANLTGTLKSAEGGTAVRDAWVGVARTKDAAGNATFQWEGGAPVAADGTFGLSLDFTKNGEYRIEFNPPWGSAYARFTSTITISGCTNSNGAGCSASTSTGTGTWTSGTPGSLTWTTWFPTSSISGKVCDAYDSSSCTGVAKSWLNVFKYSGATESWTELGSGSDMTGAFRLAIPDNETATYRIEVNPAWENPRGVRKSYFLKYCDNGGSDKYETATSLAALPVTCANGVAATSALNLQLGKPNVSATVKAGATAVARAWIEVRNSTGTSWVSGTNADGDGKFELSLSDGTYLLRTFSGGTVQKAPVQLAVTVANDSVTVWAYCGSLIETATQCAGGATYGAIDMDDPLAKGSVKVVTLVSDLVGAHFIAVSKCTGTGSGATCSSWTLDTNFTVVTDSDGEAKLNLPAGDWKIAAVPLPGDGSLATYVAYITGGSGTQTVTWATT